MENTLTPIEVYMELDFVKELDKETQEEIRRVRTEYEFISREQYDFLIAQGVLTRTRKLKNKNRSLFVCSEGRVWVFNFYRKSFEYIAHFAEQN